eukprot:2507536-Prymnesium_polylepis.3
MGSGPESSSRVGTGTGKFLERSRLHSCKSGTSCLCGSGSVIVTQQEEAVPLPSAELGDAVHNLTIVYGCGPHGARGALDAGRRHKGQAPSHVIRFAVQGNLHCLARHIDMERNAMPPRLDAAQAYRPEPYVVAAEPRAEDSQQFVAFLCANAPSQIGCCEVTLHVKHSQHRRGTSHAFQRLD